jgi:hypothetical protein
MSATGRLMLSSGDRRLQSILSSVINTAVGDYSPDLPCDAGKSVASEDPTAGLEQLLVISTCTLKTCRLNCTSNHRS